MTIVCKDDTTTTYRRRIDYMLGERAIVVACLLRRAYNTDALALAGAVYPASQAMVNVRSSAQYTSQLQPMIMMMHQPKAGNRIYM